AGAGEVVDGKRTLYQTSLVSFASFSSWFSLSLRFVTGCALPAFGATSLSIASDALGFSTRFQLTISKLEPLSIRIMMFSLPLRSGLKRRFELARSWPVA